MLIDICDAYIKKYVTTYKYNTHTPRNDKF